ncbi:hypothetical protein [Peredibacter starrii]|uniref:Uncharacterized protein n=1 Tax=Peredibacter starrii TaxID=28202 RepID=A0AAX4HKF2_9BACT|nr:hypothetical protein [Peredibacter starrii]WPU63717.1 hypothetical protein SOO65_13565 [Peredibacter starrii]
MRRLFSYIALLGFALNAWSYNERGNSGFTIICENPEENKFYDAYEAEHRYYLTPVYPKFKGDSCLTDGQCLDSAIIIAREFLERLPEGELKEHALLRLKDFVLEVNIKNNIEILPVNDIGIGFIPRKCTLRQTIVQRVPIFVEDFRYIIANDYWKLLSTRQKAVGIVHEILYGYYAVLKIQPESSEKVRYLNALVISGKIKNFTEQRYLKTIQQVYSKNEN